VKFHPQSRPRHLVLVLGDQLDAKSAAFDGFDPALDSVWMAEVAEESAHVWTHQARIALFLAAMRHFRDALRQRGFTVHYRALDDTPNAGSLAKELIATTSRLCPQKLIVVQPGEWRVEQALKAAAQGLGMELEVRTDRHFLSSREEFAAHAKGRKQLRMEFFYREMRRKHDVLMDGNQPVGGTWNFDADNRESFGKGGPGDVPQPVSFPPDKVTREVLALVTKRFAKHPGSLAHFDWPVTPEQAQAALRDFIEHRLPNFGKYEDAMWSSGGGNESPPGRGLRQSSGALASTETDAPGRQRQRTAAVQDAAAPAAARRDAYLFHSRLSAAMNLKLLDPREVIAAAEEAYRKGRAPQAAVEGFIRQILGWREYVRGIYWRFMPLYLERNELQATLPLPAFYWTGDTDMNCLRHVLRQTLEFGYSHHIQRLMVTGLFAQLLGVKPRAVHEWYLAVYVDAVEWVELPNTLGMSQHADGGLMASKPYVASGKYIQRMSNYCAGCRYDPAQRTGPKACPFTTLYWDFLLRHEAMLAKNPRMVMQARNASRLTSKQRREVTDHAARLRAAISAAT
jgi:deoxyribodipyrimidine photolyase-related protein